MLLLASTSDLLRVITSAAITVDVHASWVDVNGSTVTPGRANTLISTATTTTVVASPASSTYRSVKTLTVRNRHATTAVDVTIIHSDGSNVPELIKVTLSAGDAIHYDEHAGFIVRDAFGRIKTIENQSTIAAVNALNTVVLTADQTNNNGTANTMQDVTGLSFSVTANERYWFYFCIFYTAAATTTGSRWSINGPASPTLLAYTSNYTLTATTQTVNYSSAYDAPAASNASSLSVGNIACIEGHIQPSGNGTVIARFASEVLSSAIIAKEGSFLQWVRTR